MAKSTLKQKLAFKELLEKIQSGGTFNLQEIMKKAGYSEATAHNPEKNLTSKDGWKQLLAQIDDQSILARLYQVLIAGSERNSIEAGKELLKLKNRYPDKSLKIGKLDEEIGELFD